MKLTEIVLKTLETHFEGYTFEINKEDKQKYSEEKPCFIKITKNGKLRSESGNLRVNHPLWKELQLNSIKAGFGNKLFLPLKKEELSAIKIEVFLINNLTELEFENEKDLINKLNINSGVVLRKGAFEGIALPCVWESIQSKRGFLEELSLKAGLKEDSWSNEGVRIWVFDVENE